MLSALSSRSGALRRLVLLPKHESPKVVNAGFNKVEQYHRKPESVEVHVPKISEKLEAWEKASIFNVPKRYYANQPLKKKSESGQKFKDMAEEWYELYSEKTGLLGPAVFCIGLVIAVLSKQVISFKFAVFTVLVYLISRRFGLWR